jgi:hypothetical protein
MPLVLHFLDFIFYGFEQKANKEFITNIIVVCLVSSVFKEVEVDPVAGPSQEGKQTTLLPLFSL